MMASLPNPPPMNIEEYLQLDRENAEARYEYIDVHLRMLADGTPNHAKISANLIGVLYGVLEGSSCSVYSSDVRVCLSETRYTSILLNDVVQWRISLVLRSYSAVSWHVSTHGFSREY